MNDEMKPPLSVFSDSALMAASALQDDDLERRGYAEAVVAALSRVGADDGFVISVEGRWGCGKTSCLSMIEALLRKEPNPKPIIVHFNPWLVGSRDQLLTQFLNALALELGRSDSADDLKGISKALKDYSHTLELVGLIPGAEPFASIVKRVLTAVSRAAGGVAEQKKKSIEERKKELESALKESRNRIIVFIDDIDRLYPTEAYEMVRIIKAVGNLPNVGFVVAWDPDYVAKALDSANVPNARDYLRKVVQIPLPVPSLTEKQRQRRLFAAINGLGEEAAREYFPESRERMSELYFSALRKLIDTPRDINRLFNSVSLAEVGLRGEIVLADIIGLACINQFAPKVFAAIQRNTEFFLDGRSAFVPDQDAHRKLVHAELETLLADTQNRKGVESLIFFLFPNLAKAAGRYAVGEANPALGHLADEGRLKVALAMQAGSRDASISDARKYLADSNQRPSIEAKLNSDNAKDFIGMLRDVAEWFSPSEFADVDTLAKDIARLADIPHVADALDSDGSGFGTDDACIAALVAIAVRVGGTANETMARAILTEPRGLTVAAEVLRSANDKNSKPGYNDLVGPGNGLGRAPEDFAENAIAAAADGRLWRLTNPTRILRVISNHLPLFGKRMLEAIKISDPKLDKFAKAYLYRSFSSSGGRTYSLPSDGEVWGIMSKNELIEHAKKRLQDPELSGHERVAWRSAAEDKKLVGDTGEPSRY